jgi:RES domain-containing protein
LLEQIDQLGTRAWTGTAFRHTAPGRDPLSGEGARLIGGRWNNRDGTPTIYLAEPEAACRAEITRLIDRAGPSKVRFPRAIHTVSVDQVQVVDLTTPERLTAVELDLDDIRSDDRSRCQRVGEGVAYLGFQGVLAPSATGVGFVLAVFEPRISLSQLIVLDSSDVPDPR